MVVANGYSTLIVNLLELSVCWWTDAEKMEEIQWNITFQQTDSIQGSNNEGPKTRFFFTGPPTKTRATRQRQEEPT